MINCDVNDVLYEGVLPVKINDGRQSIVKFKTYMKQLYEERFEEYTSTCLKYLTNYDIDGVYEEGVLPAKIDDGSNPIIKFQAFVK